jgi:hypothetical protein
MAIAFVELFILVFTTEQSASVFHPILDQNEKNIEGYRRKMRNLFAQYLFMQLMNISSKSIVIFGKFSTYKSQFFYLLVLHITSILRFVIKEYCRFLLLINQIMN